LDELIHRANELLQQSSAPIDTDQRASKVVSNPKRACTAKTPREIEIMQEITNPTNLMEPMLIIKRGAMNGSKALSAEMLQFYEEKEKYFERNYVNNNLKKVFRPYSPFKHSSM
jgi:hypothetical protein